MTVTGGTITGMKGWPRVWRIMAVLVVVSVTVAIVNITSYFIEDLPGDRDFHEWEPWLWEGSSLILWFCIVPCGLWLYDRWRPERIGLPQFAGIQGAAFIAVTLTHVGGMVLIRKLGYVLMGHGVYNFSHGHLPLMLLYEGRKDALSYAMFLGLYWLDARLCESAPLPQDTRLEIRDSGRTYYLEPNDILLIEAAGNYVEVHTNARKYLVRGTLNAFAGRLDQRFIQVHRSRIINRHRITSHETTTAGDVKIRMDDGREITGSRRYKKAIAIGLTAL